MRYAAALLAALAGCSSAPVSPEHAERQRLFDTAMAPCKKSYPSIRNIELDEYGRIHADVHSSAADLDGFNRCARDAMMRMAEQRPLGMGQLATKVGTVTVAFTPAGRLMLVPVTINGVTATLLLDTGASVTFIRPALAEKAGIVVPVRAPRTFVQVAGGERFSVPFVKAQTLSIGEAAVEGIDVGVMDALVRGFPPNVDGILGTNYLNHFRMTIDRGARQLILEPGSVADPRQRPNRDRQL